MMSPVGRTLRLLVPLTAALSLSVLFAAVDLHPRSNPHAHFSRPDRCPRCHVYLRGALEKERFAPDADTLCLECHTRERLGRTHPVGKRPSEKYHRKMRIPEEFPLNDDGALMCLTCHTAHGPYLSTTKTYAAQKAQNDASSQGRGYYKTYYLRRSSPVDGFAALCDGCHKKL